MHIERIVLPVSAEVMAALGAGAIGTMGGTSEHMGLRNPVCRR